jgi:hypothetical protein
VRGLRRVAAHGRSATGQLSRGFWFRFGKEQPELIGASCRRLPRRGAASAGLAGADSSRLCSGSQAQPGDAGLEQRLDRLGVFSLAPTPDPEARIVELSAPGSRAAGAGRGRPPAAGSCAAVR